MTCGLVSVKNLSINRNLSQGSLNTKKRYI